MSGAKIQHLFVAGEIDFGSIDLAREVRVSEGSSYRESTALTRKMVFGKYQKTFEGLSATVCSLKINSVAIWSPSTGFRQFSLFPFEGGEVNL